MTDVQRATQGFKAVIETAFGKAVVLVLAGVMLAICAALWTGVKSITNTVIAAGTEQIQKPINKRVDSLANDFNEFKRDESDHWHAFEMASPKFSKALQKIKGTQPTTPPVVVVPNPTPPGIAKVTP